MKMGRCLSPSLLLSSVAIQYHIIDNSYFRSSIVCLETAPVNMWVVFAWSVLYLLTTLNPKILHKIIYKHGWLWLWEGCAQLRNLQKTVQICLAKNFSAKLPLEKKTIIWLWKIFDFLKSLKKSIGRNTKKIWLIWKTVYMYIFCLFD